MLRTALLTSLALAAALAQAAEIKPAELPPVKPGWSLLPEEVPDAKYERLVNEDDQVKVVEVRERGVTKKVNVQLKKSPLPDYEILIADPRTEVARVRRDGPVGTRVWQVTEF